MSQFSTTTGVRLDFSRGAEIHALFGPADPRHPDCLKSTIVYHGKDGEQKYAITARQDSHSLQFSYELARTFEFSGTCRNIFHEMLNLVRYRVATWLSPEQKSQAEEDFNALVRQRREETLAQPFVETTRLLKQLAKPEFQNVPLAVPGETPCTDTNTKRGLLIFRRLPEIHSAVREFLSCRSPDRSADVFIRMKDASYQGGLFSAFNAGSARPFIHDDEKYQRGCFSIQLGNGKTVYIDRRIFGKDSDVAETDRKTKAAVDLAEKLYGGGWTREQQTFFSAALDEMTVFYANAFEPPLDQCPSEGAEGTSEFRLLREFGNCFDLSVADLKQMPSQENLTPKELIVRGAATSGFSGKLAALRDDQMLRAYFAASVSADSRFTKNMSAGQIKDVVDTFSTLTLSYSDICQQSI
jgi:hypothetical protein